MRYTTNLLIRALALPVLIGALATPVSAVGKTDHVEIDVATTPPPAPEPGTLALAAFGGVAVIAATRRRKSGDPA